NWLGAKTLVHDPEFSELGQAAVNRSGRLIDRVFLRGTQDGAYTFGELTQRHERLNFIAHRPAKAVLGAIALSSGSTGKPKGVMHTQLSLLEIAKGGQGMLEAIGPYDTLLMTLANSFAAWLVFVLPAVGAAAKTYFASRFEAAAALKIIEQQRITIAPLVPTMWRMVLGRNPENYDL